MLCFLKIISGPSGGRHKNLGPFLELFIEQRFIVYTIAIALWDRVLNPSEVLLNIFGLLFVCL